MSRRARRTPCRTVAFFAASVLAAVHSAFAVGPYTITDLGAMGGDRPYSWGLGINNAGVAVGEVQLPDTLGGGWGAFVYANGAMSVLPQLTAAVNNAHAFGINAAGSVVGYAQTDAVGTTHGFLYANGVMHDFYDLDVPIDQANGINTAGHVVGTGGSQPRAVLYNGSTATLIPTLGGSYNYGTALNDLDKVVGNSAVTGDTSVHAFYYDGSSVIDLQTLGGDTSYANAIADSGDIVGTSTLNDNTTYHAFLYHNGVMTDLGSLGGDSFARSINAHSDIVGDYADGSFLYSGGAMVDLMSLLPAGTPWTTLLNAWAINDAGDIVGAGLIDGSVHAYIMAPVMPEPATLGVILAGATALLTRRARR